MRSECVFCRVALTHETRSRARTADGRLGPRNRSWCVCCDTVDAPVRARRLLEAERQRQNVEALREARRRYKASEKGRTARRQQRAAARWRNGTTFRCVCGGRFKKQCEAWRLRDGVRVRLGLCRYCADTIAGPSKHDVRTARGRSAAA